MIDQAHINLMTLIPGPFKKAGSTGGGEYHGPCPFCGGKDRFIIQPNADNGGRCWCRHCEFSGDALAFVMKFESLDFKAACERLNVIQTDAHPYRPPKPQPPVYAADLREDYACFDPAWQKAAYDFADECNAVLMNNWGGRAGQYLERRGIDRQTAVTALLGVNMHRVHTKWGSVEVRLPRGITIPWEIDQQLWNIRVRRPNEDVEQGGAKYLSTKGAANGMYRVRMIFPDCTVVMTEGEFDALVLEREFRRQQMNHCVAVSIGSNQGAHMLRWASYLAVAKRVYLAFDDDEAGKVAVVWWSQALGRKLTQRIKPSKKDITEMWQANELPMFVQEIA